MFYKHLKGVLTAKQCDDIVALAESRGFEEALVNQGDGSQKLMKHVRNNDRVIVDDWVLRLDLQAAIQDEIPQEFRDADFVVMGSYFRIYRYVPGQFFKPHRDGSHTDEHGCESEITVLFYLNDCDGGETVLMPFGKVLEDTHIRIQPRKGDVLMFEHHVIHSGEPVRSGEKYVLRTDLFYSGSEAADEIAGGTGVR